MIVRDINEALKRHNKYQQKHRKRINKALAPPDLNEDYYMVKQLTVEDV